MSNLVRIRPGVTLEELRSHGLEVDYVPRKVRRYVGFGDVLFPEYDEVWWFPSEFVETVTRVLLPCGGTARILSSEGDRVVVAPEVSIKTFNLNELECVG